MGNRDTRRAGDTKGARRDRASPLEAREVTMVIPATQMVVGDRLRNGKTVSFRIPIDASQTPGITTRLNCTEMAAVGFTGESLPVLFTDNIRFQVFRRKEPSDKEKDHG